MQLSLQAGEDYANEGNKGLEANFNLYKELAYKTIEKDNSDIIVFPEYCIAGWPYPEEKIINSLAESIPGKGKWYQQYKNLAQEIKTSLIGWLVDERNNKYFNRSSYTRPDWTEIFYNEKGEPQSKKQLLKRFNNRYDSHQEYTTKYKKFKDD
ncbi:MAG: nitrilase-related carbon-nitrogen hydrolase [Halanaerobiaceae bacterium]